jgi:ribosomal-protein-serine acetyltransferase
MTKEIIPVDGELYLRKISIRDAETVFQLTDSNREHLARWLPFAKTTYTVHDTLAFIRQVSRPSAGRLVFVMVYRDRITGLLGYKDIDLSNRKLEIGYWIAAAYEGKGIVTRCCKTAVDFAFEKMKINRVQIKCAVDNIRSSNIPKRLGFVSEGIEREGDRYEGGYRNLEIYAMLKKDWPAGNIF